MIDIRNLKDAVVKEFDQLLTEAGFRRIRGRPDENGFTVNYQSGSRYVSLRANTHPPRVLLSSGSPRSS